MFLKLWAWLDGKKTKIAAGFYLVQDLIVPLWFDGGTPPVLEKALQTVAITLVAVGLGHGVVKGARK